MTALDVVVIVAGLLFGYRLVSNYLSPSIDEKQRRSRGDNGRRDEAPMSRDWERHWESPTPKALAWFDVLGVAEHASLTEIEYAYRTKISQHHPDKVAHMGEDIRQLAETRSKEINAAYEAARCLRK